MARVKKEITVQEALNLDNKVTIAPKKRGRKPSIKKTPFKDAVELFAADLVHLDKSELTVKNYTTDLHIYEDWFKKNVAKNPKLTELENAGSAFLAYATNLKRSSRVAPTTANRRIISIKKFFEFLYTNNYTDEKFGENITLKKVQGGSQHAVKWLKREDVGKILEAIPLLPKITEARIARNKAIILVLVNCGLRVSELTDLRFGDIDVSKNILSVRSGKGDKFRQVPITNGTLEAVDNWLKYRIDGGKIHKDDFIFTSERGSNLPLTQRGVQHLTKNLSNLSGVEFSPHTLRHTYCKQLADKSGKIQVVAELAGHSNINVTRVYTTPSMEELTEAVEDMEFTSK